MGRPRAGSVVTVLEFDTDAIKAREVEVGKETDEQIIDRLNKRFEILHDMTGAVKMGDVRAMIVSGPPGVGKSYSVEYVLEKSDLFTKLAGKPPKFEIVKGAMSALGLYCKLHQYKDPGQVIVFDDCDSVLFDELSLNILKAALDSSETRSISWNTDSRLLRGEGIPNKFNFHSSAIFITNIKFAHVRSKRLKDHLNALESRCHYIDLEMDTSREKMLRIKQVISEGMLDRYDFDDAEAAKLTILNFLELNKDRMRELSLRMVLKVADLMKAFPNKWTEMAKTTLMRRT